MIKEKCRSPTNFYMLKTSDAMMGKCSYFKNLNKQHSDI